MGDGIAENLKWMVHHDVKFEMADIFRCGENTKIENHMASTAIYVSKAN